MFELKAINQFKDLEVSAKEGHDVIRKPGDIFTVQSIERASTLLGDNPRKIKFCELVSAKKRASEKYEGNKIIIYQNYLYYIGGIETFIYNLTKNFKDRNITVVVDNIENAKAIQLSEYCDIIIDNPGQKYECDVLILGNYNSDGIMIRVKTNKIYQMIHADWEGLTKIPIWSTFKWTKSPDIDEVICVSDTAARGLKKTMNVDSKVIYNILDNEIPEGDMRVFITLSRATPEKGINRILEMAKRFKAAGKHFIWFLCCSLEQTTPAIRNEINSIPEFIVMKPGYNNQALISHCDYLVQLSDTESFCYSAFEALQRNVPVILTEFPEAYNIIDDGENGYILKFDLSNLDIDKIFNEVPKNLYYIDRCDKDDWEAVFRGEF